MKTNFIITSIICLIVLCQSTLSQTEEKQEKTKLQQNKDIVRSYMNEILNEGRFEALDLYLPEELEFNNSIVKSEQLAGMLKAIRISFPDFHISIEDQISEGDKVVTRVIFYGTHLGEYRGIAPTGKEIEYSGIAIDRIADGKVVEMWHIAEMFELLLQIGANYNKY